MSSHVVLCVDDETHILQSLKRLLRKEDYELVIAGSGREGLEILEQKPAHLVVSDQRMPEMPGTDFLRKVKEIQPQTMRVILSGYADVNIIIDAINKGEVYRFLTKPWNDDELKICLRQCLQQHDLVRDNIKLLDQIRIQNEELKRLNEGLKANISERTTSLHLSQNFLDHLPLPVIGISREGIVALVNKAFISTFPPKTGIYLGLDIDEVLPPVAASFARHALEKGIPATLPSCEWEGRQGILEVAPLEEGTENRGCILVWKGER